MQYVDDLLSTLVSFRPELQETLQQLQDQVHLTAKASEAEALKFTMKGTPTSRKQTVPEPFSLAQPKPKLRPIEEPLAPPVKYGKLHHRVHDHIACQNHRSTLGMRLQEHCDMPSALTAAFI